MTGGRRAPRVLVTGTEYPGGLAAVRALRRAGFEPWVAAASPGAYGARSRDAQGVRPVPDPRADVRGFARAVACWATELDACAVLPGTDAALLALAEYRAALPGHAGEAVPPSETVRRALDKGALAELLAGTPLGVPPTRTLYASDVHAGTGPVALPAVVKPPRSELDDGAGGLRRFESVLVRSLPELRRALGALPGKTGLVQQWVDGPLVTVNGVAWRGRVVAAVHQAADRTWPLDCGIVCYARTVAPDPALQEGTRTLLARLGWSGIFNLQAIASREGPLAIDLNPRLYHSLALAVAAGANLPAMYVSLLLGHSVPSVAYRRGVRFRSEEDLRAVHRLLARGRIGAAARAALPRLRTAHAVVALRDPLPAAGLLRRAANAARAPARSAPRRGEASLVTHEERRHRSTSAV